MPPITLIGGNRQHLEASRLLEGVELEQALVVGEKRSDKSVQITIDVKPSSLPTFADHFVNDAGDLRVYFVRPIVQVKILVLEC